MAMLGCEKVEIVKQEIRRRPIKFNEGSTKEISWWPIDDLFSYKWYVPRPINFSGKCPMTSKENTFSNCQQKSQKKHCQPSNLITSPQVESSIGAKKENGSNKGRSMLDISLEK